MRTQTNFTRNEAREYARLLAAVAMIEQVNQSSSFQTAVCAAVPTGIVLIVITALAVLSGCAANFSTLVANHPECAVEAGIAWWKVERCLGYGNVHRDAFDMCLMRQQVPQRKIEMLDNCAALKSD